MFRKYAMNDRDECLLAEYEGTGLTPDEIKKLKATIDDLRDYIEWLEEL